MEDKKEEFSKQEYDRIYRKINLEISFAIFLVLLGTMILTLATEFLKDHIMVAAVILLAGFLGVVLSILLSVGKRNKNYQKKIELMKETYTEEEKSLAKKKVQIAIMQGTIVLIPCIGFVACLYGFQIVDRLSMLPFALLFFVLMIFLPRIAFQKLEQEKMDLSKQRKQNEKQDQKASFWCAIITLLGILFSILVILIWNMWDLAFLLFFTFSILAIGIRICPFKKRKGRERRVMKKEENWIYIQQEKIPIHMQSYAKSKKVKIFFRGTVLYITKPKRYSSKRVEELLKENEELIHQKYQEAKDKEVKNKRKWITGENILFDGEEYKILRKENCLKRIEIDLWKEQKILLIQAEKEESIEKIEQKFFQFLKGQTSVILRDKLPFWCEKTGFSYEILRISNTKSKYGSCIPRKKSITIFFKTCYAF